MRAPPQVGTLEEMIDDNHAIISTPNGPEYYVRQHVRWVALRCGTFPHPPPPFR